MADKTLTMFGKAYNTVGSADSNLLLLTRGDLKVRWGNKFIDLIKNGKINVDVDVLQKADTKDSIIKDGIYLVKNEGNNEIWISIGGETINLYGNIGTDYVSYLGPQEVTSEQRYLALQNIGICFNTYQEAVNAKLSAGIVFCVDTNKLYTINEGELTEYSINIEWPDQLNIGKISIDGKTSRIYSNSDISFGIGEKDFIKFLSKNILILFPMICSKEILSNDYGENSGFSIYEENGQYTLVIDNIIIRGGVQLDNVRYTTYAQLMTLMGDGMLVPNCTYVITDFQNEWELTLIIYTEISNKVPIENSFYYREGSDQPAGVIYSGNDINVRPLAIKAKTVATLESTGYFIENPDWIVEYDPYFNGLVSYVIDDSEVRLQAKGRITRLTDKLGNTANFDFKHKTFKIFNPTYTPPYSEDEEWRYLFNEDNPDYYRVTPRKHMLPFVEQHRHKYRDASEHNENIRNNNITLPEPIVSLIDVDDNGTTTTITVVTLPEDFVVFEGDVYDNTATFEGKYYISGIFSGNDVKLFKDCNLNNAAGIKDCIFLEDVEKLTLSNEGELLRCKFLEIYAVYVDKTISDSSFKELSGTKVDPPIEPTYLSITGPLDQLNISEAIVLGTENTPNAAESLTDTSIIQPIVDTFAISIANIPRLGAAGGKACYIANKTYEGNDYKVFCVGLSAEDTTPPGIIAMYSGIMNSIPSGWVVCDGSHGTPDLRGRFIRMVDIGELCGSKNNVDLNIITTTTEIDGQPVTVNSRRAYLKKVLKHTHTYKTYSLRLTADYSGLSIDYDGEVDISNLLVNKGTLAVGGNNLSYSQILTNASNNVIGKILPTSSAEGVAIKNQNTSIMHTASYHSLTGNPEFTGNITLPPIEVSGNIYVDISATPELAENESGFVDAINIEPLAYALIFIMKL